MYQVTVGIFMFGLTHPSCHSCLLKTAILDMVLWKYASLKGMDYAVKLSVPRVARESIQTWIYVAIFNFFVYIK